LHNRGWAGGQAGGVERAGGQAGAVGVGVLCSFANVNEWKLFQESRDYFQDN